MRRKKTAKLDFFVAVKNYAEDIDVNCVLTLFPITVVTHGAGDPPPCFPCSEGFPIAQYEALWQAGQVAMADALGGKLVVAENTGHSIADENFGLVITVVTEVIAAVLDPTTWATPAASPSS